MLQLDTFTKAEKYKFMATIIHTSAREIIDSRGNPTVEVDILLENGILGRAAVPSGASTGDNEALELRDGALDRKLFEKGINPKTRYAGKGVLAAVSNVNDKIAPAIEGLDCSDQLSIDKLMLELDGSDNKKNLGANAILGVSLAVAKAAAEDVGLPLYSYLGGVNAKILPIPMMNVMNGGAHSDAPIDIQEFMIVPRGAKTFREAVRMGAEIFHALKKVLKDKGLSTAVGDEGGFAPNLASNEEALEVIAKAVKESGYSLGKDIFLALDVAASEFYDVKKQKYIFKKSDGSERTSDEMVSFYKSLQKKFPIISIEDGCSEHDWLEKIDRCFRKNNSTRWR